MSALSCAIGAGHAVWRRYILAPSCRATAERLRTGIVIVTVDDATALARATDALIIFGTRVAVTAWIRVVVIETPSHWIATLRSALIIIITAHRVESVAAPSLA